MAVTTSTTTRPISPSTTNRTSLPTVQRISLGSCSTTSSISSLISSARPWGSGAGSGSGASSGGGSCTLMASSVRRPDRELELGAPAIVGGNRPESPADVEAQRPDRQVEARPDADHVAHLVVADRVLTPDRFEMAPLHIRRMVPDIPDVEVSLEPERPPHGHPQLEVGLQDREPAAGRDRVLLVAAHRVDAPGAEAVVERHHVLLVVDRKLIVPATRPDRPPAHPGRQHPGT